MTLLWFRWGCLSKSAKLTLHNENCQFNFIQTFAWHSDTAAEWPNPCEVECCYTSESRKVRPPTCEKWLEHLQHLTFTTLNPHVKVLVNTRKCKHVFSRSQDFWRGIFWVVMTTACSGSYYVVTKEDTQPVCVTFVDWLCFSSPCSFPSPCLHSPVAPGSRSSALLLCLPKVCVPPLLSAWCVCVYIVT